ncbi:conserved hypothetical protein [Streptomyces pristinaespiralis ATCC 25486]|uniref:Uncharacterized protein n=1 Tax=Streptomyces pristinaespiralis (strain ATCC 25486 / DSM 40338 / CBS 914.69 / JCM 4507 / KCC S-0507 / NBRC 13074 / NRRL 2958 / 5647) TaxID=457429 RepID=B5HID3_STRE2|nr:conserved hypothetical protein [Streptomyces pristinaespiralis ATCC 25486]
MPCVQGEFGICTVQQRITGKIVTHPTPDDPRSGACSSYTSRRRRELGGSWPRLDVPLARL